MDAVLAQPASAHQVGKDHIAMKKFAMKGVQSMVNAKMALAFVNTASLENIALLWDAVKMANVTDMVFAKLTTTIKMPSMIFIICKISFKPFFCRI